MAASLAKTPIQVHLRPEQLEALRSRAQRCNVSVAELVRQGVDRILEEAPWDEDPALDIIGIVNSGLGDLAEEHDDYIVKWLREERR
jgi:hypothetical protein